MNPLTKYTTEELIERTTQEPPHKKQGCNGGRVYEIYLVPTSKKPLKILSNENQSDLTHALNNLSVSNNK